MSILEWLFISIFVLIPLIFILLKPFIQEVKEENLWEYGKYLYDKAYDNNTVEDWIKYIKYGLSEYKPIKYEHIDRYDRLRNCSLYKSKSDGLIKLRTTDIIKTRGRNFENNKNLNSQELISEIHHVISYVSKEKEKERKQLKKQKELKEEIDTFLEKY